MVRQQLLHRLQIPFYTGKSLSLVVQLITDETQMPLRRIIKV